MVTIVVPCFNEARRIQGDRFRRLANDTAQTVLFVNDGSTDNTLEILQQVVAADPVRLALMSLDRNSGKAEAVRQGLLRAVEANALIVGYIDADFSVPEVEVQRLLSILHARPDLQGIIGSRVRLLGSDVNRSLPRHLMGRIFATVASYALNQPVYDTQCGAKFFRVNSALSISLRKPFVNRWSFDVELLGRLSLSPKSQAGSAAIIEEPLKSWCEIPGSKMSVFAGLRSVLSLLHLRRSLRRFAADLEASREN